MVIPFLTSRCALRSRSSQPASRTPGVRHHRGNKPCGAFVRI